MNLKSLIITSFFFAVTFLLSFLKAWGADFQKGLELYKKWNFKAAVKKWKPLAEQGNLQAQLYLGDIYYKGKSGFSYNHQEVFRWYQKAAKQGNAKAQSLRIAVL